MQQSLFQSPSNSTSTQAPELHGAAPIRRKVTHPSEPERTLFGLVETKRQARKRAQEIVRLIDAIETAPEAIAYREQHIESLAYFIERSRKVKLDPNDLDGLVRMVGDTQWLLTEGECHAMHRKKIWRLYPLGWLGVRPGQMYPAALHPKEIAFLREMQDELRDEMEAITAGAEVCESELVTLRAVGSLPDDVAERYSLTPDGHSKQPHAKRHDTHI